ncbi:MAG TPA: phosphoribosyltransferase family protein [Polyangia bacterium]|jgi:putative phosphoribosyl transferase
MSPRRPRPFRDREHAGTLLGEELLRYRGAPDLIVLALPRGGVPVGAAVARALGAPLDVFVVRKLGLPGREELAMGAIASGGVRVVNEDVIEMLRVPREVVDRVAADEELELGRRERVYRADKPPVTLAGRTVILVDDGLATGASMRAAVAAVKERRPARLVVAVPVAAATTVAELRPAVDDLVCLVAPEEFSAVNLWYDHFPQLTDAEVRRLLAAGPDVRTVDATPPAPVPPGHPALVRIPAGEAQLDGELVIPEGARGLVVFAHGSGSSRHSPRNRLVARALRRAHLATLLMDLLTIPEENRDRRSAQHRFDIPLLASRLVQTTAWLAAQPQTRELRIGYFGASTGAAAALVAAAEQPEVIGAVVSRGGRPDLAGPALARVAAPTMLIVGGLDVLVVGLNQSAWAALRTEKRLEIVPGASHLFQEPGALERVAELARGWFATFLQHP